MHGKAEVELECLRGEQHLSGPISTLRYSDMRRPLWDARIGLTSCDGHVQRFKQKSQRSSSHKCRPDPE